MKTLIILLTLLIGIIDTVAQAATSTPITICSDGVRLAGDLWKPDEAAAGGKRPAVLMVHGWGGFQRTCLS